MTLQVNGLGVWRPYSGLAFERVALTADAGQVWLVAGRNGAGASTLLAALAGLTGPGERRVGTVRWGRSDLTFAHPDELAAGIGLVGESEPAAGLTVADLVGRGRGNRRVSRADGSQHVLERLGLADLRTTRMDDLTGSERIRARLAGMIARRPGILLLDQMLGALESVWRPLVCALVREYADAGALVLWAEQDLAHAVQVADRVLELGPGGALAADAWTWRPAYQPWTPVQKVATALGAEGPDSRTVEGLRPLLDVSMLDRGAPSAPVRGSLVPIDLGDGRQIQVDDTAPPAFLCDSARSAIALRDRLWRANVVPALAVEAHLPVRRIAREADRLWRLTPETTLRALIQALPAVRPASWLAWHSRGEQARLRTALACATPTLRLLYEPFAYLDGAGEDELLGQVRRDWLGGLPALVVTTDVDAASRFPRVIVWKDGDLVADGRPEAVLDDLPATPLVARLTAPRRIVDVEDLLVHLEGSRA